jgi:hypothetical protein
MRLMIHENILGNAEIRKNSRILVHRGYSALDGVVGARPYDRLTTVVYTPHGGLNGAGCDFDQR